MLLDILSDVPAAARPVVTRIGTARTGGAGKGRSDTATRPHDAYNGRVGTISQEASHEQAH